MCQVPNPHNKLEKHLQNLDFLWDYISEHNTYRLSFRVLNLKLQPECLTFEQTLRNSQRIHNIIH
jgi:hypothetical protein